MNKKLDVYYKSQSAQSLDDCLKVYSGYVKDVQENLHTLEINCEDRTEMILDQKLPIRRTPISDDLPEKRRDVPIPIAYGVLDRAALIYNSLTEIDANKHYVAIADDFPIKSCSRPKVFLDNSYCNISKSPEFFQSLKESTVYKGLNKNQYIDSEDESHLGEDNSIIFETQYDVSFLDMNQFYPDGSPVSANIVEVLQKSDVAFKDASYSLKWDYSPTYVEQNGLPEGDPNEGFAVCPVRPHTDIQGLNPSNNFYYTYFMPSSDFEGFPQIQRDNQDWLWDMNQYFYGGNILGNQVFFDIRSLNMISAETIETFPSQNILNVMPHIDENQDDIEFKSRIGITYSIDSKINFGDYEISPLPSSNIVNFRTEISFMCGTRGIEHLILDDTPITGYSYQDTDGDSFVDIEHHHSAKSTVQWWGTDDISNRGIEIGNRYYSSNYGYSTFQAEGKALEYLKFNSLKVHKQAILKGFDNFKLYAKVEGRVDNIYGRYTGEALSASSSTASATTETPSNSEGSSSGGGGGY